MHLLFCRVSKKPLIVKKRNNPNVFEESLPPLGGRWQKSLIFDG